ncbi:uncharacterized protein LOC122386858 [Amphibalanus amphitrite]|uniref:uncharacterized protein LOC122386858 n=1 Tax=Amphibalanus amphitrite TaxID=1232801 RepID=UPI001C8FCCC1|nr:uncharacterized protein LOC122386858 [Amphibalanus amphitrite]
MGYLQLRSENAYQQAKTKLMDRYGNEFVKASTLKNRIRSWPAIRSGDGKGLREFADFLEQCQAASSAAGHLRVLDDQHENSIMLKKLPKPLVDRWRRYVDQRLYEPAGVDKCKVFLRMKLKERQAAVMRHGLCRGCLKRGHIWRSCQKKQNCETCGRRHPTALHDETFTAPTSVGQDKQQGTRRQAGCEAEIGLLIGANCPKAVKPRDVVTGEDDDPWAVRSALGWGIVGPVSDSRTSMTACQYVDAGSGERRLCHFAFRTAAREMTPMQVAQLFEQDFKDTKMDKPQSVEDRLFLKKMTEGTRQREDGHFEMPLPLKEDVRLPNNKAVAMQRLKGLKSKLVRNEAFRRDYTTFMEATVANGHAEKVPEGQLRLDNGRVWYLPHHGVYHPKKPGKIRVVFDCSAEFGGQVLNNHLLQGPDMTNSLTGILCRFRKNQVAVTCDIQGMFNQVGVDTRDRDFLRFMWWENGDLKQAPQEYRMTTHLFGARSSPACVMFALRKTADIEDEAIDLIDSTRKMCTRGGFTLHKLLSNSVKVLESVSPESRCSELQSLDVGTVCLPVQRALGVEWDTETDVLQFSVQPCKKPSTRRGILSTVSSVFDPLGFVSPFILRGKQIVKELCRDGFGWDDPVPDDILTRWGDWTSQLEALSSLRIPRCYRTSDFGLVKRTELHHFSDACTHGYGQCSYLRLIDEQDRVCCRLVMSKARVTPSKPVTVPRLELTAALTSVQVSCFLREELDIEDLAEYFWTDSRVVLGYISNDARRFHVFVGNRVQQIRDHTEKDQWLHVETKLNPADLASRGASAAELESSDLWWNGPPFLRSTDPLPGRDLDTTLDQKDPEVRRAAQTAVTLQTTTSETVRFASLTERLERFSDWHRAKRAVALCLRYKDALLGRRSSPDRPLTVTELEEAETVIVRAVQEETFTEELRTLSSKMTASEQGETATKAIKKTSKLHRLDPYVNENGVIYVGGRIRRADLPASQLHPMVLPRAGHVTRLVIDHCHKRAHHPGRGMTIAEIRSAGFWIVGVRGAVSRHILHCVMCKRIRGTFQGQKMSDLPEERLVPSEPFTYSGVDLFGPFYVKERRSELKRWGVMFTCLASRAVHIETVNSLSTDSFLNAFRRFVGRRGPVRTLRCDRGTNFVGGKAAMEAALDEMDAGEIQRELLKNNCDWVDFQMNAPCASHMGGIWERMIRSARAALDAVLKTHAEQMDDEVLRTVMVEVEARWRRVQYLTNLFWSRWMAEVLPTLQERRRWTREQRGVEPGDVVLMAEPDSPRSGWPLARVLQSLPSRDGLVRKVRIVSGGRELERPVHQLVMLVRQTAANGEHSQPPARRTEK